MIGHLPIILLLLIVASTLPADSRRCGPRCFKKRKIVKFIHVSDIHFDPSCDQSMDTDTFCHSTEGSNATADYEAPYGRIGCDSPEWLWESTLSAMKEKGEGAKFILLTGKEIELLQLISTYWLSWKARWKNIWPSVIAYEPTTARSVSRDQEPNIFPSQLSQ